MSKLSVSNAIEKKKIQQKKYVSNFLTDVV